MYVSRCFLPITLFIALTLSALDIDVSAEKAILINGETGKVLFEKRSAERHYPASTTKIATALFALERTGGKMDQYFVASPDALKVVTFEERMAGSPHWNEPDGTTAGLKIGQRVSLDQLLHGLMLPSGNDAANVIAEGVGGSVPRFVGEMNLWLQEQGLSDTHFVTPHGLFHPDHVSTAADLAQVTRVALRNPQFRKIVKRSRGRGYEQFNKLVTDGEYFYPGAIGVKTGNLRASGKCLVAAAERDGRQLIAVLLGCPTSDARFEDAIRLFDAAYDEEPAVFEYASDVVEPLTYTYYPSEKPEIVTQSLGGQVQLLVDGEVVDTADVVTRPWAGYGVLFALAAAAMLLVLLRRR
jgi:serine-type D-Ala-D-Ala carboxypeptidase (penicillin-binding protein 5/6)